MRLPALAGLLPWLNGDPLSDRALRRRLLAFLRSFDGSPAAGCLRVYAAAGEAELRGSAPLPEEVRRRGTPVRYEPQEPVSAQALDELRMRVLDVVRKGFPYDPAHGPAWGARLTWSDGLAASPSRVAQLPSLLFGVRRAAPEAHRLSKAARRRYRSEPGAYEVWVDGELRDLVPYLVMRVLTLPGAASLARCTAPAAGHPREGRRCGRLFVRPAMGRPRIYCSGACKVRAHTEREEGGMEKGYKRRKR